MHPKWNTCVLILIVLLASATANSQPSSSLREIILKGLPHEPYTHSSSKEPSKNKLSIEYVPSGKYPWSVSIATHYATESAYEGYVCTGALVAPSWVVTTASCVAGQNPEQLDLYIGATDMKDPAADGEKRSVRAVHFHDQFNQITAYDSDVALLELEQASSNTPSSIASASEVNALLDRAPAMSFGWSGTGVSGGPPQRPNDKLMEFERELLLTPSLCQEEIAGWGNYDVQLTGGMVCAQALEPGDGSCGFFAGEPLHVQIDGQWKVVGVNSWKVACPNYGITTPTVDINTKLTSYESWIDARLNGVSLTSTYDFLQVPVGVGITRNIKITNWSSEPVTIATAAAFAGDSSAFEVDLNDCSNTPIEPFQYCLLGIRSTGANVGLQLATVDIETSAPLMKVLRVTLAAEVLRELSVAEIAAIDAANDRTYYLGGYSPWEIYNSSFVSGDSSLRTGFVDYNWASFVSFFALGPTRVTYAAYVTGMFPELGDGVFGEIDGKLVPFSSREINWINGEAWHTKAYFDVPEGSHLVSLIAWARSTDDKIFGIDNLRIGYPIVNLPEDIEAESEASLEITASSSDVDGYISNFSWEQVSGPVIAIDNTAGDTLRFISPSESGTTQIAVIKVTVTDNDGKQDSDTIKVTVRSSNIAPIIYSVVHPNEIESGHRAYIYVNSRDPDSTSSTVNTLVQAGGTPLDLVELPSNSGWYFDAPSVQQAETIFFAVTAKDYKGATTTAQSSIILLPFNNPPTVDAGDRLRVAAGAEFHLNATALDSDGVISSYLWQQTAGTYTFINSQNSTLATVIAPRSCVSSQLTYQVSVVDDRGATASDSVIVDVSASQDSSCSSNGDESTSGGGGSFCVLASLLLLFLSSHRWHRQYQRLAAS